MEGGRRVLGEDNQLTLLATATLGGLLVDQHKDAEAEALLAASTAAARKTLPEEQPLQFGFFLMNLGRAQIGTRAFAAAQANLLEAQPILLKNMGPKGRYTRPCTQAIVDLYTAWNMAEPGKGYDAKGAEWKRKLDALGAVSSPAAAAR
jgi:hypothetical protein